MNEVIFLVEETDEGGFTARTLGASIFTEAEGLPVLHERARDAVRCHFDEDTGNGEMGGGMVHAKIEREVDGRGTAR